jgi:hypothetical protein
MLKMFIKFDGNPCGKTTGDCVIRAISVAENMPWRKVYLSLCVEGYSECTFGDDNKTWDKYVRSLGYQRYTIPDAKSYKLSDFANAHKEGTFIVGTGTHAVAVVNGDVIDAWDSSNETPLYYYSKNGKGGEQ